MLWTSRAWHRRVAAGLVAAGVLSAAGCSGPEAPGPNPPPTGPTTGGVPANAPTGPGPSEEPAPEPSISYAPGAEPSPGGGPGGGTAPEPTAAAPGQPAPTAAGPLDERALPRAIAGYTGVPGRPTEGEYHPNGTWVHAADPAVAGYQALPMCGSARAAPTAAYALAGSYAGPGGATGNGLALQFPTSQDARAWYAAFVDRLAACPPADGPVTVTELTRAEGTFTARRRIAYAQATWSETGRVSEDRVLLIALSGTPDLHQLGAELERF